MDIIYITNRTPYFVSHDNKCFPYITKGLLMVGKKYHMYTLYQYR